MPDALSLVLVGCGGVLGGALRYSVAGLVDRRLSGRFPWGTLAVNLTGSGLIGAAAGAIPGGVAEGVAGGVAGPGWLFLVIGVLGSYTTVSSFSLQTLELLRAGRIPAAAGNVALSVGACVLAAALGMAVARGLAG